MKKTKLLVITLLLLLSTLSAVLSFASVGVFADTQSGDPEGDTPAAEDYIEIGTYGELIAALTATQEAEASFKLTADIDFAGKTFLAGSLYLGPGATLDGNNFSFLNVTVTQNGEVDGLFSFAENDENAATIKNLTVGTEEVPAVATCSLFAYSGVVKTVFYTAYENVTVYATLSSDSFTGVIYAYPAGMHTFKNVTVNASVVGGSGTAAFIGRNDGSAIMDNCTVKGTLAGANLGAFVGKQNASGILTIKNSTADVMLTGTGMRDNGVGGLVGLNQGLVNITGSTVVNMPSASYPCGSLVGNVQANVTYSGTTLPEGNVAGQIAMGSTVENVVNDQFTDENGYIFAEAEGGWTLVGYSGTETELTLPESYEGETYAIADMAFYNNNSLTSVTIPDGVFGIGASAFYGCTSLTEIVVPNSVTYIGISAFCGCNNLESLMVPFVGVSPNSSTQNYLGHFFGAASYTYNGYYTPTSLKTVMVTGGAGISNVAFYGCTNLTSITVSNRVTRIDLGAFSGCTSLESITLPFLGPTDGGYYDAYLGYAFGASSYYENGTYVPTSLKTVTITGGTSINAGAFYGCSSLTSVTVPDSVTSIGDNAFYGCSGLTSIAIPKSVMNIGDNAFYNCSNLTNVYITDLTAWCRIDFSSANANPLYFAGNLYLDGDQITGLVIPDSVTGIKQYAFYGCTGLTSVTIPNSVTSMGNNAFYGCSNLTGVYITDLAAWCQITFSNEYANPLYYANKLYLNNEPITDLVIPDSVTRIGNYVFSKCKGLTYVVIPTSVEQISTYAFSGCQTFTVYYGGSSLEWQALAPNGVQGAVVYCEHQYENGTIVHPFGAYEKYDNAQHAQVCECGETVYGAHKWDDGMIISNPSEFAEGVMLHVCADCKGEKTEPIDKLPAHTHTYDNGIILTNPSEYTEGVKVFTCACGHTKLEKIDKLPAHTHTYDNGVVLTNPSEQTEGVKVYTCTCGHIKLEKISKLPAHTHTYDDGVVLTNPTEQTEGVKVFTCTCGDTKLEKIDKLPAHTHTYDDGVILTNPSEDTEGVKVYTCACGVTRLEAIPVIEGEASGCNATITSGTVWMLLLMGSAVGLTFKKKKQ